MRSMITAGIAAVLISGGYFASAQRNLQQPHQQPAQPRLAALVRSYHQMEIANETNIARLDDMDAKIEILLAKMDAANGPKKVQVMTNVVKTLVAQRRVMETMMITSDSRLLNHLAQLTLFVQQRQQGGLAVYEHKVSAALHRDSGTSEAKPSK